MLPTLGLSTSLGIAISCNDITPKQPISWNNEIAREQTAWPQAACFKLTESYDNVTLSVISKSGNYTNKNKDEKKDQGVFSIDEVQAGRLKVEWKQLNTNKKLIIWLAIDAYQDTWVFRKSLRPEKTIRKRDVKKKKMNVAKILGVQDLISKSPEGKTTKKFVRKNQIVTENLLTNPPLIVRNQKIIVRVVNNGLKIKTQGIALKTGWQIGDVIDVKIGESEGQIKAIVAGDKTVNVEI